MKPTPWRHSNQNDAKSIEHTILSHCLLINMQCENSISFGVAEEKETENAINLIIALFRSHALHDCSIYSDFPTFHNAIPFFVGIWQCCIWRTQTHKFHAEWQILIDNNAALRKTNDFQRYINLQDERRCGVGDGVAVVCVCGSECWPGIRKMWIRIFHSVQHIFAFRCRCRNTSHV